MKKNILDIIPAEIKGVNTIIHLGEIANDPASELNSKLTWENSCLGMRHLCEISKKYKIKKFIMHHLVVSTELKKKKSNRKIILKSNFRL